MSPFPKNVLIVQIKCVFSSSCTRTHTLCAANTVNNLQSYSVVNILFFPKSINLKSEQK